MECNGIFPEATGIPRWISSWDSPLRLPWMGLVDSTPTTSRFLPKGDSWRGTQYESNSSIWGSEYSVHGMGLGEVAGEVWQHSPQNSLQASRDSDLRALPLLYSLGTWLEALPGRPRDLSDQSKAGASKRLSLVNSHGADGAGGEEENLEGRRGSKTASGPASYLTAFLAAPSLRRGRGENTLAPASRGQEEQEDSDHTGLKTFPDPGLPPFLLLQQPYPSFPQLPTFPSSRFSRFIRRAKSSPGAPSPCSLPLSIWSLTKVVRTHEGLIQGHLEGCVHPHGTTWHNRSVDQGLDVQAPYCPAMAPSTVEGCGLLVMARSIKVEYGAETQVLRLPVWAFSPLYNNIGASRQEEERQEGRALHWGWREEGRAPQQTTHAQMERGKAEPHCVGTKGAICLDRPKKSSPYSLKPWARCCMGGLEFSEKKGRGNTCDRQHGRVKDRPSKWDGKGMGEAQRAQPRSDCGAPQNAKSPTCWPACWVWAGVNGPQTTGTSALFVSSAPIPHPHILPQTTAPSHTEESPLLPSPELPGYLLMGQRTQNVLYQVSVLKPAPPSCLQPIPKSLDSSGTVGSKRQGRVGGGLNSGWEAKNVASPSTRTQSTTGGWTSSLFFSLTLPIPQIPLGLQPNPAPCKTAHSLPPTSLRYVRRCPQTRAGPSEKPQNAPDSPFGLLLGCIHTQGTENTYVSKPRGPPAGTRSSINMSGEREPGACSLGPETHPIFELHTHTLYSSRAAPQTPHHTLNAYLPLLVCTPKHPRLPIPPDSDPSTASPPTFNTHSQSPASTGSPGNIKAPARAPGPGKSLALQAWAPPPPHAPLPLPKVGGHSAVQWGHRPEGGCPALPFPHKPPRILGGRAPPGPLQDSPPRAGTHPPLRTAGWARPAPGSARRLCIRSAPGRLELRAPGRAARTMGVWSPPLRPRPLPLPPQGPGDRGPGGNEGRSGSHGGTEDQGIRDQESDREPAEKGGGSEGEGREPRGCRGRGSARSRVPPPGCSHSCRHSRRRVHCLRPRSSPSRRPPSLSPPDARRPSRILGIASGAATPAPNGGQGDASIPGLGPARSPSWGCFPQPACRRPSPQTPGDGLSLGRSFINTFFLPSGLSVGINYKGNPALGEEPGSLDGGGERPFSQETSKCKNALA
ncbi:hypothetical protein Cadr_000024556 [Camelus dromedarius]|uniref:Uncharacterized protein n=1 Tax=Camelus dromedarius TaxID=9838 RepID=A0A5N4CPN7_CAMDR|nr:hypothetical protein Cadr_000024556 [Camelus dromedarius]